VRWWENEGRSDIEVGGGGIGGVGEVGGSPARLSVGEKLGRNGDDGGRPNQRLPTAFVGS
jgi:hypothetical protein